MLDRFHRVALSTQFLLLPAIVIGFVCVAMVLYAIFSGQTSEESPFLMPGLVGALWAMVTYAFLVTFRVIPEPANRYQRFVRRMFTNLRRGWYWLLAWICIGTTLLVVILTYRMLALWITRSGVVG